MTLDDGFNLLATAPDGIKRLRELILSLAVQGKLVPQDPSDEPASELLKQIRAEKQRLVAEGKIKKDKELPVIAPDEQPFEIPATHELIRLGTVLSMVNGRAFRSADWICEGIPIIRIQNLNNIDAPFNYCAREGLDERHLVRNGNLLISWSGTPGTSFGAFIWNRGEAALNQHIFRCEQIGSAYDSEFLKLAINSQLNVLISQAQGGVGLQHVTKGTLESLVLPLPPLAEQARIVAKVEELMALCDALEARGQLEAEQHARLTATLFDALAASESAQQLQENWARLAASFDLVLDRPQAVDALEQTILQLAVRGLLVPQDPADQPASELLKQIRAEKDRLIAEGKIKKDKPLPAIGDEEKPFALPVGWEWARLSEISAFITDGEHATPERTEDATQIPLVTAKNVRDGAMDYSVTDFVPRAVAEKCWQRCKPEEGDILMVSVGATLGRLSILEKAREMVLVRSVTVIRPVHQAIHNKYLSLYLKAPLTQIAIWASVKQSAQPCLYLSKALLHKSGLAPVR